MLAQGGGTLLEEEGGGYSSLSAICFPLCQDLPERHWEHSEKCFNGLDQGKDSVFEWLSWDIGDEISRRSCRTRTIRMTLMVYNYVLAADLAFYKLYIFNIK